MKSLIIANSIRSIGVRIFALGLFAVLSLRVTAAHAQADQILPPSYGDGGAQYVARCPVGEVLTGFDLHTGDDVDAIRPLCVAVRGTAGVGPIDPYPSQFGGDGGAPLRIVCPTNAPLVTGIAVLSEGVETIIVNNIHLFCGVTLANQALPELPSAVFDGPPAHFSDAIVFARGNFVHHEGELTPQTCPKDLVPVGINGRSGKFVDALGLICGALPDVAPPPKPANVTPGNVGKRPIALGRVKTSSPATSAQSNSPNDPPICASARSARMRNSPAAPGLERQCAAARANPSQSTNPEATPSTAPGADGPPVRAPSDLSVVSIQFFQEGNPVQAVRMQRQVTIKCTYVVDLKNQFSRIQPWQGRVQVSSGNDQQYLEFQGRPDAGEYSANVTWTPTVQGQAEVSCIANSRFANAEATLENNRWNVTVNVLPAPPPNN